MVGSSCTATTDGRQKFSLHDRTHPQAPRRCRGGFIQSPRYKHSTRNTNMTRLDWERDRRDRLPKDVPTDDINIPPRVFRRPRKPRPPALREISKQTKTLETLLKGNRPSNLLELARALEILVHEHGRKTGRTTKESMNAREIIKRIRDPSLKKAVRGKRSGAASPLRSIALRSKTRATERRQP